MQALLRLLSESLSVSVFVFRVWLWVLRDDRNDSRQPAESIVGISKPTNKFPVALVCDSVGKSPAWRGLDAARTKMTPPSYRSYRPAAGGTTRKNAES